MNDIIIFLDTEVGVHDEKIHDIGAVCTDGSVFHSTNMQEFCKYISRAQYICGHNIIHHDMKYLVPFIGDFLQFDIIDTLYLSPLLFPKRPYHALLKDDKLQTESLNNPVNDAKKAEILLKDEVDAFCLLPLRMKKIFCWLLWNKEEFKGFFSYVNFPFDLS